jgi:DnaK suppressor protein
MAKRLTKKANAVKLSRKSEITKNTKTTAAKKAKAVKKTPAAKVTKKVISSSHKPVKSKAAAPKKAASSVKAKIKPAKTKSIQVKVKADLIASKKTQVVKPIKHTVNNVKKPMTITTEQKIIHQHEENYMNPQQQKHFRTILLDWKKQLLGEMERTVHHMQDEAANFPDPNDRATQEEEFSLELRARDRERKLIKKIDEALVRLDNHDYGYCEACGVEIGEQRLSARPTATLCIDCKTIDEIREKHFS